MFRNRVTRSLTALFFVQTLTATALAAQPSTGNRNFRGTMRTGIGYTAVLPDVLVGAGFFHLPGTSKLGGFAEGKITLPSLSSDGTYCPPEIATCDAAWVEVNRNDFVIRTEREWLLLNAGAVYAVTPELLVMLGAGAARRTAFREYFDETSVGDQITETGRYIVDDPDDTAWTGQAVLGAMLRAGSRLTFRFGYETAPGGGSAGIYFILP